MTLIQRILHLPNTRNVAINTAGSYIGFLFAGFYTVFLVRVFRPDEFGVLTILLTLSYLLANILSFGMPASIYAHVPGLLQDKQKVMTFVTSNILFLTVLSGLSLLALYVFITPLDTMLFKTDAPAYQFGYALIGTQLYIWQNFIRDVLNAAGKFLHVNVALNIANVIKVVLLVWLAMWNLLGITQVLIILGMIGPAVFFAVVLLERRWILKAVASAKAKTSEIKLGYTMTYFLSTQLFQLASRADIFMVSFFLTRPEVGFYGLSQRIILAVITSADSITQVMSPQFARVISQREVMRMLKHSFTYMLLPAAMFIGGIILPPVVYELVFGNDYGTSTSLTKLLSFAYLPFPFLAAAVLFFLYTIKKPLYLLKSNVIFLVAILAGNSITIPLYRLYGPPVTYLTAFAIMTAYIAYSFRKELMRLPR